MPALATKDFALRFLAFKEGVTAATVTFTNDITGEYLFHELNFVATPPGVQVNTGQLLYYSVHIRSIHVVAGHTLCSRGQGLSESATLDGVRI